MLKEIKTRPVIIPMPVLIIGTYDADGIADAMNVAWGGQCTPDSVAINIGKNHKTTENILLNKAFTLHIGDASRVELADYVGIVSGKNPTKLDAVKATVKRGEKVNAPIIEEFTVAMECEVTSIEDEGPGMVRVVGKVVRTVADDSVLGEDDKINVMKLRPLVFDMENNDYHVVGESVARAYEAGKRLLD